MERASKARNVSGNGVKCMKVVVSGIPRGYQAPLPGGFWLTEEHRKKIEGVSPEIELVEILRARPSGSCPTPPSS